MSEPGQASAEWSEQTARHVTDMHRCPRCGATLQGAPSCSVCHAVLDGAEGAAVWQASVAVADALRARAALIAKLPIRQAVPAAGPPTEAARPVSSLQPGAIVLAPADRGGYSVQSLLAVAGAGLFAVAAVVFVFFNPDLTDLGTRTVIVGAIAALFLAGAWLLARRGLTFSAEAIGALGAIFVGLTASGAASGAAATAFWTSLGIATLVATIVLFGLAQLIRLRSLQWFASVGLTITPAFFGFGGAGVLGTVAGALGSVAAALVGHALLGRSRVTDHPATERTTITVLQVVAAVIAVVAVPFVDIDGPGRVLIIALVFAVLAALAVFAARIQIRRFWSLTVGASAAAAIAVLPFAAEALDERWLLSTVPLFAALALIAAAALPRLGPVRRTAFTVGVAGVLVMSTLPATLIALGQLSSPLLDLLLARRFDGSSTADPADALTTSPGGELTASFAGDAAVLGLFAVAAGLAIAARIARSRPATSRAAITAAVWMGVLAALAATPLPLLVQAAQIALALALAVGLGFVILRFRALERRLVVPIAVGAHLAVVLAAFISWEGSPIIAVIAGAPVLGALAVATRTVPEPVRFVHVGAGYAYALGIVATAFDQTELEPIAVLSLTVSVGAVAALVTTAWERIPVRAWYAVLVVTALPFLAGVASVLVERTGWTALSTALIAALAVSLVLTRRPRLSPVVRIAAAAIIVPAVAVVLVTLGAWSLPSSGSPVVLPVIAVVVGVVLAALRSVERLLAARGHGSVGALEVAVIQLSTLLTAAITVLLSLLREAAGLGTTVIVLLVLGAGAAAARVYSGRRWGWWLAAACWTGALWSVWALVGVGLVEAYILPPALAAVVVGLVALARHRSGAPLVASGLAIALLPTLVLLLVIGDGETDGVHVPWRASALLIASALFLVAAYLIGEANRFRPIRGALLLLAVVAAAAGPVQAVRYGLEVDVRFDSVGNLLLVVLLLSVIAVTLAVAAARRAAVAPVAVSSTDPSSDGSGSARWRSVGRGLSGRWGSVPAVLYLVAGPISTIRDDWAVIWTLWTLMMILLVVLLISVSRAQRGPTLFPPVIVTYLVAWITAVVAWSPRDLRVEWFSLPLGLAVLAAGVLTWAHEARSGGDPGIRRSGRLSDWPRGWGGSWRLLGPGIFLTILPSVLATGTDPATPRAILVIALALAAILVGSARRLAAPFVLGLVALPIENIVVFVVQIGREISALPWWITLATAGAVLLALAVTSERKTAQGGGVAARIRELR
ncbi:SCO7613 C-terminal domain-containing membrane protein [Amnibacterium flavum]|uniref:Uncharacterized protein n=1 Tax=Amnibacterium flavum TaxID=2173173 RepID=A0A2V1HN93_9MICO|nr:hypothetical protein [Amnibacterium flavum]PVZ94018.1 hypothetical protein DDQ50_09690 [Amnibacterium flavum]